MPAGRAVEESRRIVCQRIVHRHERRQVFVIDLDRLRGAERRRLVHRHNRGNRVADIAHPIKRNHRLVAQTDAVELIRQRCHVLAGHNAYDARHRQCSGGIDMANAGMRQRAAQQLAMQKTRKRKVPGVDRASGNFRTTFDRIVAAACALLDAVHYACSRASAGIALRTASTMAP